MFGYWVILSLRGGIPTGEHSVFYQIYCLRFLAHYKFLTANCELSGEVLVEKHFRNKRVLPSGKLAVGP